MGDTYHKLLSEAFGNPTHQDAVCVSHCDYTISSAGVVYLMSRAPTSLADLQRTAVQKLSLLRHVKPHQLIMRVVLRMDSSSTAGAGVVASRQDEPFEIPTEEDFQYLMRFAQRERALSAKFVVSMVCFNSIDP